MSSTQVTEVGYEISTISSVSYSEIGTRIFNFLEEQGQLVFPRAIPPILLSFNEYINELNKLIISANVHLNEYINDRFVLILSQVFNPFEYIKESITLSQSFQSKENLKERFNITLLQAVANTEPITDVERLIISQSYKKQETIKELYNIILSQPFVKNETLKSPSLLISFQQLSQNEIILSDSLKILLSQKFSNFEIIINRLSLILSQSVPIQARIGTAISLKVLLQQILKIRTNNLLNVIIPGNTINLSWIITDNSGNSVALSSSSVSIYDPNGNLFASNTLFPLPNNNVYISTFTIPSNAPLGIYTVDLNVSIGSGSGATYGRDISFFEVII